MDVAMALLTSLAVLGTEASKSSIEATVSPGAHVRECQPSISVDVTFKNISERPIILLSIHGQDNRGAHAEQDRFVSTSQRLSKALEPRYARHNLLAPDEGWSFSLRAAGTPGRYRFAFRLDYLTVDDGMLELPVFEILTKDESESNSKTPTKVRGDSHRATKTEVGTLGAVWRGRRSRAGATPVLPYFVEVSSAQVARVKSHHVVHLVEIDADPDIRELRATHPSVNDYRGGIPHFGLAFLKDGLLHVKQMGGYKRLGRVSFDAITRLGALMAKKRSIRLRIGNEAPCLRETFADRLREDDSGPPPAAATGNELPLVDLAPSEMDRVWTCMERDGASMTLPAHHEDVVVGLLGEP